MPSVYLNSPLEKDGGMQHGCMWIGEVKSGLVQCGGLLESKCSEVHCSSVHCNVFYDGSVEEVMQCCCGTVSSGGFEQTVRDSQCGAIGSRGSSVTGLRPSDNREKDEKDEKMEMATNLLQSIGTKKSSSVTFNILLMVIVWT